MSHTQNGVTSTHLGGDGATFLSAQPKEARVHNLLSGKAYTSAVATDIRHTFAKFCPMWAEKMKSNPMPLPVATVTTHYRPTR